MHVVRAVLNVVSMLAFFVGPSMTPPAGHRTLVYGSAVYRAAERAVPGRDVPLATLDGDLRRLLRRARNLAAGIADLRCRLLLVLVSSLLWSMALIDIKVLGRTDSSTTITAYVTVLMIPMTLVP